jgi:ATP-binding cassette subfamily C (CFTR/MRP) protein 1
VGSGWVLDVELRLRSGNTIARFSKDMDVIDTGLPDLLSDMLLFLADLVVQFAVLTVMQPVSLLFALPTAAFNVWLSFTYSPGIGFISRLESSLSSPCYAIFQETLNGLPSVRAVAGGVEAVTAEHQERVQVLVQSSLCRQGT